RDTQPAAIAAAVEGARRAGPVAYPRLGVSARELRVDEKAVDPDAHLVVARHHFLAATASLPLEERREDTVEEAEACDHVVPGATTHFQLRARVRRVRGQPGARP